MRRAIFGGSFDPPTSAHYHMVRELSALFDEVIVVPARVSPFKPKGTSASGKDRLEMLNLLFKTLRNVTISDVELSSPGVSYTYITVEKLKKEGCDDYFAIGSDLLCGLENWKNSDLLASLVTFYLVERPYFPVKEETLAYYKSRGFRIERAPFYGREGSSSMLKVAVAFGRTAEETEPVTADYIESHGLYREYCAITNRYDEFRIKPSRREHIYGTAEAAILLAGLNGADRDQAAKAALLHDITKYLTDGECEKLGLMTDEARRLPERCRHQATGAAAAKKLFGVRDEQIIAAIASHTTGAENMTLLQKIIFAADFIEKGRAFEGIDEIRALTYADLDRGILAIMEHTLAFLRSGGGEICGETQRAYNSLKRSIER